MTVGTAIVVSIGIICVTFLAMVAMGMHINNKKQKAAADIAEEILKRRNKNT